MSDVTTPSVGALAEELREALDDPTPRRAHEIIAALLDMPRFWPATHRDDPVTPALRDEALVAVARLAQGAPLAYAVRRAPFRHLTLQVDERVLIPRPETELLVDELFRLLPAARRGGAARRGVAVDVGTGSGAIALSLAAEGNFARVVGIDRSPAALVVARENAAALGPAVGGVVEFRCGSLLEPVRGERAAAIVSNPPYIAFEEVHDLPTSVRDWEPAAALFSGDGGMAATTGIVRGAADILEPGGVLILETDTRRAPLVAALLLVDPRYEAIAVRLDLTGRERFVVARRRSL